MALPPKVCPECREEYMHQAQTCVDCDVPLVLEGDLGGAPAPPAFPPAAELEVVRSASVGWSTGLSERLSAAGIAHRIEAGEAPATGGPSVFGVFVRAEDLDAAREIDAGFMRTQMPDLPEGFDPASLTEEDAAPAADTCPACGDPVAEAVSECPGCGLFLG